LTAACSGRIAAGARFVVWFSPVNDLDAVRRFAVGLLFPDVLTRIGFSDGRWVRVLGVAQY
jgi:hypothetical protein